MIKGFTLIEVLVTMSLLAMVVLIGGFVYQSFQTYQLRYVEEVDLAYGDMQWLRIGEDDLDKAYSMEVANPTELRLWTKEGSLWRRFEIVPEGMIRIAESQRDTLLQGRGIQEFMLEDPFTLAITDTVGICFRHRIPQHAWIKTP